MLQHPRLKNDHWALHWENRGVLLLSDEGDALLPAGIYEHLIPLLNGQTSTEQLTQQLQGRWRPVEVWYALWHLERLGCIEEAANHREPVPPATRPVSSSPARVTMAPIVLGEVPAEPVAEALLARGIDLDAGAPIPLVLTDSYLRPELAELNQQALDTGRSWLLARPVGPRIWLGPHFHPNKGCCWRCLGERLRRNHPHEYRCFGRSCSVRQLSPGWSGSASPMDAMARFAELLTRYLAVLEAESLISFDPAGHPVGQHKVPRRPQCPSCGDPALTGLIATAPLRPGQRAGTSFRDDCLDPVVGTVRELRPVASEGGAPLHVWVGRYGSDPLHDDGELTETGLSRASGRGFTEEEAQASALGEAIERYSAVFQGDEPRIIASLKALGTAAIHPNECMQFSESQYRSREGPRPLDPEDPIDWTPVQPLRGGDHRYLPTMLLYSGYPMRDRAYCVPDPSGGAAGSSREEALLRGLLELVERDSLALWWYNRVPRPCVNLGRSTDGYCESLRAHYRSHNRELWALDITSDIGIPSFAAISRQTAGGPERIVLGFGTHLHPAVALTRALTEMDQVLTLVASSERSGSLPPTVDHWLREATISNQPYLAPAPVPPLCLENLPVAATNDHACDLELCEELLARRGLKVLFLDQTRPDIGLPVVKAIVPGLRHFRPRFAPGRLFSAPVEAGWLDRPRLESELNPIGFFL